MKVLRDGSVDSDIIEKRRIAMRELGKIYISYECDSAVGLKDIVEKFLWATSTSDE
jgi:hypothetical protein